LNLLFLGQRAGGVGRYARELPGAILAAEPDTEITVLRSRDAPGDLDAEPWASSVRWVKVPVGTAGALPQLIQQIGAPLVALLRGLDVLHSPANSGPVIAPRVTTVVTVHDLIWLVRADEWEADPAAHAGMERLVRHSVRHADRVFADSRAGADDLVSVLGVPRERTVVVPLGVRRPPPAGPTDALRERLGLGGRRVVLCVAQKRPYKNLHRLLDAVADFPPDAVVVLPGSSTPYEQQLRRQASELGVADRVVFPDWLSEADLERTYALADVFVLPSLIEGFGLPVLEAMARDLPVACSDIPALSEVAGDAALRFDPESPPQIAAAVGRLLADEGLRRRLIAAGRERAAEHTWLATGRAALAGYRQAITAHRARGPRR